MERSDDVLIGSSMNTNGGNSFVNSMQNGDLNSVSISNSNTGPTNNLSNGINNNNNNNNNNGSNNSSNSNERPPNVYTMPGILHYLQHEWNRFELDRQQWDVERSELMTKISFLQGERRGQENLKNNLVRRIKMLELALKQERLKYQKLKLGEEMSTNQNESKFHSANPGTNENDITNDIENNTFSIGQHPILNKENTTINTTKQGRQLLKQYLQEIGFTDTIIDVRSSRLRTLLGIKAGVDGSNTTQDVLTNVLNPNTTYQLDSLASLMNGNKQLLHFSNNNQTSMNGLNANNTNKRANLSPSSLNNNQQMNGQLNASDVQKMLKLNESDPHAMLMMNNLDLMANRNSTNSNNRLGGINNSNFNANDDDEEMNDDEMNEINVEKQTNGGSGSKGFTSNVEPMNDADTEDALKEFSFLTNESSSSDDQTDWNVDKIELANKMEQYKKDRTEQYKKERQKQSLVSHALEGNSENSDQWNKMNSARPNRQALQAMIANLNENNQADSNDLNVKISEQNSSAPNSNQKMNSFSFSTTPKLFMEDDAFGNDSNLGELSRISVNNNNVSLSGINDETIVDANQRKAISSKFSLRGHFDSIRCLAFHPTESALLTGSEDQTIKLWNLDKSSLSNKKNVNTDIEPVYTFRKHESAVLSLILTENGEHLISSDLDSKIIVWNMPNYETADQYDPYSPNVFAKYLAGHTDAVWGLTMIDNTLISISSDSTIRLWNPLNSSISYVDELKEANVSCISCLNQDKSEGVPSSVDYIKNDKTKLITSFGSSHHILYDLETSKSIMKLDYSESNRNTHCYKVLSHPTLANVNSSLVISAHEDKKIRFFDLNSGKLVYQLVAHQDACTDIAIDPTCFYLLSASHDCSLRLWNLDNKNCIQEMTSHRKKYDESINCIAFHPTKPYIASGGADAIVKIYV